MAKEDIVDSEIQSWIIGAIEAFSDDSNQPDYLRLFARQYSVLPILVDWTGFWGLHTSGDVLLFDTENGQPPHLERDARIRRVVIFQGSKRFPAISRLVAERPDEALTCRACQGTGQIPIPGANPDLIVCYYGGLGWLLPEEADSIPRA